jgi:hypothetical protein
MLQSPPAKPDPLQHCELEKQAVLLFIGTQARQVAAPPPAGEAHCGQEGMHSLAEAHVPPQAARAWQAPALQNEEPQQGREG